MDAPNDSAPTSRAANAARVYGGACRTDRPDAANVRMRMGGSVYCGSCGTTWRSVDGGMSAAHAAARNTKMRQQATCTRWAGLPRTDAPRAIPPAPDLVQPDDPAPAHQPLPRIFPATARALENTR